jgi:hypothetical protein
VDPEAAAKVIERNQFNLTSFKEFNEPEKGGGAKNNNQAEFNVAKTLWPRTYCYAYPLG